jgi:hypothetical protein
MDANEIQARATIAAALIAAHAVEIPSIPKPGHTATADVAAGRLRDLTDYVYRAIIHDKP